jgi:hypothetical protein
MHRVPSSRSLLSPVPRTVAFVAAVCAVLAAMSSAAFAAGGGYGCPPSPSYPGGYSSVLCAFSFGHGGGNFVVPFDGGRLLIGVPPGTFSGPTEFTVTAPEGIVLSHYGWKSKTAKIHVGPSFAISAAKQSNGQIVKTGVLNVAFEGSHLPTAPQVVELVGAKTASVSAVRSIRRLAFSASLNHAFVILGG